MGTASNGSKLTMRHVSGHGKYVAIAAFNEDTSCDRNFSRKVYLRYDEEHDDQVIADNIFEMVSISLPCVLKAKRLFLSRASCRVAPSVSEAAARAVQNRDSVCAKKQLPRRNYRHSLRRAG